MQRNHLIRSGALALMAITVLIGCEQTAGSTGGGFRTQYFTAREALENGQYARANRLYPKLMASAGPLAARIQLEYAHSLLRSGDWAAAAREARALSQTQTGTAKNAALAVLGTAEHELGLTAISAGDAATGRQFLKQAKSAMDAVLKQDPDLDPLGTLAGRRASIVVRLKSLG